MTDVAIIGIGQTPIGELWGKGLRELAAEALQAAVTDAGLETPPDALYIANMLAPRISNQTHLGALIADFVGWAGIEAATIEAACGSGGMALQVGVRAIMSGMLDTVAVLGVEKMTDANPSDTLSGLTTAADADYEGIHGATFVALNALIMQRYMHEYKIPHDAFAPFAINAHRNASTNPNAMFQFEVNEKTYRNAPMISDPINRLDSSPICDGAAAVILCSMERARELSQTTPIRILASVSATDNLMVGERSQPLVLNAGKIGAQKAYEYTGLAPADIDIFELHDAFSIIAALSLEAAGFANPGHGVDLANKGEIAPTGRIPISTFGGLKARGHPIGATGVYEVVDLVMQLRGDAGENQIKDAEIGMTQNIGGTGATIITHILGLA